MKSIDIALKDIKQAFRNKTALMFMFGVPILVTGLFYFVLGGIGGDEEDTPFSLPTTAVQVVNLDQGELGEVLIDVLQSEELQGLLYVALVEDAESARLAVDRQEFGVAIIIPENFSAVMLQPDGQAEVEIYQDPTLTLGPGIVTTIIHQITDSFSGSKIAVGTTIEQLTEAGLGITPDIINDTIGEYIEVTQAIGGEEGLIEVETSSGERPGNNGIMGMISFVMGGMTIFFAFFTGVSIIQTILTEEENGTMQRLFSTPTTQSTILYGKFIASAATILIQVVVLFIFGTLVFKIYWGEFLGLVLFVPGLVAAASAFGICLISFMKTNRQASAVIGGGITILGNIGMAKLFTMGIPNPPPAVDVIPLIVPQGWAVQGLEALTDGGSIENVLFSVLGLLIWSLVFFLIGNTRFKRRYV